MYDNAKNGVSCSNTFSQDISTVEKRISNSNQEIFWTDSEVVLAYIRNEAKRFKIFVANRIELIKEHSDECQWFYISSKQNPADHAPGGIDTCNQNKVKEWLLGPVSLEAKRKLELEQNLYSCQFSSYRTEERFSC